MKMRGGLQPAKALLVAAMLALPRVPVALADSADAQVEAVQMPAWLTRDGKREPLAVGAPLRNGDTITTGEGSRVILKMAEGSTVKLGDNPAPRARSCASPVDSRRRADRDCR